MSAINDSSTFCLVETPALSISPLHRASTQDLRQLEQLAATAHDFGTPAAVPQISGDAAFQCTRKLLSIIFEYFRGVFCILATTIFSMIYGVKLLTKKVWCKRPVFNPSLQLPIWLDVWMGAP